LVHVWTSVLSPVRRKKLFQFWCILTVFPPIRIEWTLPPINQDRAGVGLRHTNTRLTWSWSEPVNHLKTKTETWQKSLKTPLIHYFIGHRCLRAIVQNWWNLAHQQSEEHKSTESTSELRGRWLHTTDGWYQQHVWSTKLQIKILSEDMLDVRLEKLTQGLSVVQLFSLVIFYFILFYFKLSVFYEYWTNEQNKSNRMYHTKHPNIHWNTFFRPSSEMILDTGFRPYSDEIRNV